LTETQGERVSDFKAGVTRGIATSKASFRALRPPLHTGKGVKIQRVQLATRGDPTESLNMRDLVGQHLSLPWWRKKERDKGNEKGRKDVLQLSLLAVVSRLPDAQDAPLSLDALLYNFTLIAVESWSSQLSPCPCLSRPLLSSFAPSALYALFTVSSSLLPPLHLSLSLLDIVLPSLSLSFSFFLPFPFILPLGLSLSYHTLAIFIPPDSLFIR